MSFSSGCDSSPTVVNGPIDLFDAFKQFVSCATSDSLAKIQLMPQFDAVIEELYDKAPSASKQLAQKILDHDSRGSFLGVKPQEVIADASRSPMKIRKRASTMKDLAYRPPTSAKSVKTVQLTKRPFVVQPTADLITQESSTEDQIARDTANTSPDELSEIDSDELERMFDELPDYETSDATKKPPDSIETSSSTLDSLQARASCQIHQSALPTTAECEATQSALNTSSEATSEPSSSVLRDTTCVDIVPTKSMIVDVMRILHGFQEYPDGLPQQVHCMILETFETQVDIITADTEALYSDGSMWGHVLATGDAQNAKRTVLYMIELIGAWTWYDRQIKLAQTWVRTRRGKLVDRKGAANHVLNTLEAGQTEKESTQKSLGAVGKILVPKDANDSVVLTDYESTIRMQALHAQRKRITVQLSRGRKLCEILVAELGLGVLFHPKIWTYIKMPDARLGQVVQAIKHDESQSKLFRVLARQLQQLVEEGCPDFKTFVDSLVSEGLITEAEFGDLESAFPLKEDHVSSTVLDSAVDGLVDDVAAKVLCKRKFNDDGVSIANGWELSRDSFDRLRKDEDFDNWLLKALMEISDKPDFVRIGNSVPLDQYERVSRRSKKTCLVRRPLLTWRRQVDCARGVYQEQNPDGKGLVHICPLNSKNTHFTLLEINERDRTIYHYDSNAGPGIVDGTAQPTRVNRMVQNEFGYLNFNYVEAPTPQQKDSSSCGPITMRTAERRMMVFPAGGWYDDLDGQRLRLDMVRKVQTSIEDGAMLPKRIRYDKEA